LITIDIFSIVTDMGNV